MGRERANTFLRLLNLAGFIAVIVVNALANALPLGGRTTGELSDMYPNLFVPAGLTFSIWGVIYILLAIFVAAGFFLRPAKTRPADPFLGKTGALFFVTCAANVGWLFAWHFRVLPLSLLAMLVLLGALILIYLRLDVGRSNASGAVKYLVHMPMSVYLGWTSIATIANVTALLVAYDWGRFGLGEQPWTVAVVAVGIALALVVLLHRGDVFYCLVVDWALLGIYIKRTADAARPAHAVVAASVAGMALLTAGILVQVARGRVYRARRDAY